MLSPKRVKFRKMFKGRTQGLATRGNTVVNGQYGLQALEPGWVSNRQIEAARVALTRHIKRGGKVWIRIFPDKPITKKPAETRMGKGKGSPEGMGGGGQAWSRDVRARRRDAGDRGEGHGARRGQAQREEQVRTSRGGRIPMPKGLTASEIREWTDVDIRARVTELEEERFRLRFRCGDGDARGSITTALVAPRHCAAQDRVAGT